MARPKQTDEIADILSKVERKFERMGPVIKRMDADYGMYVMDKFIPDDEEAIDEEDAYTSNLARVTADKVIFGISSAQRVVQVQNDAAHEEREDANDNLEKLATGILNLVDKRLDARGEMSVQDQQAFFSPVRALRVVGRAYLRKDESGATVPDMLPMDPHNFVYEKGYDGIEWACYRMTRTRADIRSQYPKVLFGDEADDGTKRETLYDYYFRARTKAQKAIDPGFWNCTIVRSQYAKAPFAMYAARPIIVRASGLNPGIAPFITGQDELVEEEVDDTIKDAGDSVFAPLRHVIPKLNRIRSYRMHITAKQADPAIAVSSIEGTTSFDESVAKKGAETPLSTANQEAIDLIPTAETGRDAQLLESGILDESHAGGLSPQSFGQPPPGGMSAAALRLLGNNIGERTRPFLRPVESWLLGAVDACVEQFETGSYQPMEVFGKTFKEEPFDGPISYQDIANHGMLGLKLVQQVPEDDTVKWATARMATTPNEMGEQLVSMEYARNNLLGIQDARLEASRVSMSRGRASAPVLALIDMMKAAFRRGDEAMVQYLQQRVQMLLMQEQMEFMAMMYAFTEGMGTGAMGVAAGGMGGGNGRQIQGGGGRGVRPEVAGQANYGPPGQPSPEAGRNSTAARPGGQGDFFDSIGLGI